MAESGTELAIEDGAADLEQEIGNFMDDLFEIDLDSFFRYTISQ